MVLEIICKISNCDCSEINEPISFFFKKMYSLIGMNLFCFIKIIKCYVSVVINKCISKGEKWNAYMISLCRLILDHHFDTVPLSSPYININAGFYYQEDWESYWSSHCLIHHKLINEKENQDLQGDSYSLNFWPRQGGICNIPPFFSFIGSSN